MQKINSSLCARVCAFIIMLISTSNALSADEPRLKPFIQAAPVETKDITAATQLIIKKLTDGGFEIVGQYSPYANTHIVVITNNALKKNAALSELGAFGAASRVTITKGDDALQIAYTNPVYMAQVYRMKGDLTDVKDSLSTILGNQGEYGSAEGLTKSELRKYHYTILMPYFTDPHKLVEYDSYKTAVDKVEALLKTGAGGAKKVYRIDLTGKDETVIGVQLSGTEGECSGDEYIMKRIDFNKFKSAGHLPYEFVISKGEVYMLQAEFRIAIHFPDLSMMGSNSFASIMCAPYNIRAALTKATGGQLEE